LSVNDRLVPPVVVVPAGRRSDTMLAPRFLLISIALGGFLTGGAAMTVKAATKTPKPITVKVNLLDAEGIGKSIGTVTIKETAEGLEFDANLKGLPPGEHGFHVHEKGSCAVADKDGTPTAGQAAGGHYDPEGTNAHKGPGGGGHKGDLPKLEVDAKGNANANPKAPGLKLTEVRGRALMIHEGGDNYSDTPKPLGGGGARIACGVIPASAAAPGRRHVRKR
jgi:Cu-Zn family superoxide dismutase